MEREDQHTSSTTPVHQQASTAAEARYGITNRMRCEVDIAATTYTAYAIAFHAIYILRNNIQLALFNQLEYKPPIYLMAGIWIFSRIQLILYQMCVSLSRNTSMDAMNSQYFLVLLLRVRQYRI